MDADSIVKNPNGPQAQAASRSAIEIVAALDKLAAKDAKAMISGMAAAEKLANDAGGKDPEKTVRHSLARAGGIEATVTFELLVELHVCAKGDGILQQLNPNLDTATIAELAHLVTAVELLAARVGHARRAIAIAHKLIGTLRGLAQSGAPQGQGAMEEARQSLVQRGAALAEAIAAKRCYMSTDSQEAGGAVAFDPRFLAFEYAFNLLLRGQQANLILEFAKSAKTGESRVNQMIMGAGKSTVVCPLLALILGNNSTLIMQVVPVALLEFSRSIMRERFASLLRKPVYTFTFDRFTAASPQLLQKVVHARRLSAVMLTSPTSLKSFVLKFIETVHLLESSADADEEDFLLHHNAAAQVMKLVGRVGEAGMAGVNAAGQVLKRTRSEEMVMRSASHVVPQLAAQARVAVSIVKELQSSLLILDEVDLILHPLKSELNWPLGKRKPLDFGASRWAVPFHLLDALFYCSTGMAPDAWKTNRQAKAVLDRLNQSVQGGLEAKHLQRTPHLILISTAFYRSHLKPLLCRWMLLLLRKLRLHDLKDEQALAYLMYGGRAHASTTLEIESTLKDRHVKLLNLSHAWLDQLLPHVLSKIDRVNYGLLTTAQQRAATDAPTSRRLLAIPFLGKDVPSAASEFAHPDVVIGFTILAYRYEGMRTSDFSHVMGELIEQLDLQSGPVEARPANVTFTKWVKLAGGRVRGTALEMEEGLPPPKPQFSEIWPLHLLDVADEAQTALLLELLSKLPQLIEHYLSSFIFPQTMLHQTVKLSANAQELGGDLLFKVRLGFSGTPSDLLPLELGHCHYAPGDDARMLHILTSPANVSYSPLDDMWSVVGLLKSIATSQPPYNALIDTGALVTGLSNLEVARALLRYGLEEVDAVVFLDELDRKMTLLRKGMKVVSLGECGVALERRFSFYDQVHTTGMDIEQLMNAHAALTLGKDMVFRDYAQGAFRLRQIGKGQRLTLHIIPEVMQLIGAHVARQRGQSVGVYSQSFARMPPNEQWAEMLKSVVSWLLANSISYERTQFKLLCEQNLAAVWRKRAYRNLLAGWEHLLPHSDKGGLQGILFGHDARRTDRSEELKPSIVVFREGVDFGVENTIPQVFDYVQKLTQRVADTHELCEGDEEQMAVSKIIKLVTEADFGSDPRAKQRRR